MNEDRYTITYRIGGERRTIAVYATSETDAITRFTGSFMNEVAVSEQAVSA